MENRNNRYYPKELLEKEVERFFNESANKIKLKRDEELIKKWASTLPLKKKSGITQALILESQVHCCPQALKDIEESSSPKLNEQNPVSN